MYKIDPKNTRRNPGGKRGGDFVHTSPTPEEPCLHAHVNDAGTCHDCGQPAVG